MSSWYCSLCLRGLAHNHLAADRGAVVEVDHVAVDEAKAAGGYRLTDGLRLIGAVNAIHSVAEVECAGAERIAGASRHETRQIGLARDHFGWRSPIWPFALAGDFQKAGPPETIAANADAVTDRPAIRLNHIEQPLGCVHDDRAGRLRGAPEHHLALKRSRKPLVVGIRDIARLVIDLHGLRHGSRLRQSVLGQSQ